MCIRDSSDYKTLGPQVERLFLTRWLPTMNVPSLEYEQCKRAYTLLRIANLFQAKNLFNFALARSVEKYMNDLEYPGNDYAHDDLIKTLANDYLLVDHVTRQQITLANVLDRTHCALLSLRLPGALKATYDMAGTIWRDWYIHSSYEGSPDVFALKRIGDGKLDVDQIIERYRRVQFRKQRCPPKHIDKDLPPDTLRKICDVATDHAQALYRGGKFVGPSSVSNWDLVG